MDDQRVCDRYPVSKPKHGPMITVIKQSAGCFVASVYIRRKRVARARSKNAGGAVIKAVRRYVNHDKTDLPKKDRR